MNLFYDLVGQTSREAHMYLHFECGAAAGSQTSLQSSALGVYEECVSWRYQLHRQQRRLAVQTG